MHCGLTTCIGCQSPASTCGSWCYFLNISVDCCPQVLSMIEKKEEEGVRSSSRGLQRKLTKEQGKRLFHIPAASLSPEKQKLTRL